MATAFDGIGMGMLGSEKKYMSQNNPLSTALSGLKDFGIMYGMEKAGLFDYLNKMGEQKQAMMDKYPALGKKPDGSAAPPAAAASAPTSAAAPTINNAATADKNQDRFITDDEATATFQTTPINVKAETNPRVNSAPVQTAPIAPGAVAPLPEMNGINFSGVSPDMYQQRDASQDQTALAMQTGSPSTYPSPMNLPQYGQNSSGSGGLSSLLKLFA